MFTSIDKAIVALLSSGAFLFTLTTGIETPVDQNLLAGVGAIAAAASVYFVPNK